MNAQIWDFDAVSRFVIGIPSHGGGNVFQVAPSGSCPTTEVVVSYGYWIEVMMLETPLGIPLVVDGVNLPVPARGIIQEPSSTVADGLKFDASGSVHPGTGIG